MAMYSVIYVINHNRVTEHTNVGVLIYGDDGKLFGHRVEGPERAVARGDLAAERTDYINAEYFSALCQQKATVDTLKRTFESMGHAMSSVQFRDLLPTITADQEALDRLFNTFVLGKKFVPKPEKLTGEEPTKTMSVLE